MGDADKGTVARLSYTEFTKTG